MCTMLKGVSIELKCNVSLIYFKYPCFCFCCFLLFVLLCAHYSIEKVHSDRTTNQLEFSVKISIWEYPELKNVVFRTFMYV